MLTAPTPKDNGADWGSVLGIGALVVGLALTVLAGVAVMILWRKDN